jgi:hypothetical protein
MYSDAAIRSPPRRISICEPGQNARVFPICTFEAAFYLCRHDSFDREIVGVRLLELGGDVAAAAHRAPQDRCSGAPPVVYDRGLNLVTDRHTELAGVGVAKFGGVERGLALVADRDEDRRAADRDHFRSDHVAHGQLSCLGTAFAFGEERGEVLVWGGSDASVDAEAERGGD